MADYNNRGGDRGGRGGGRDFGGGRNAGGGRGGFGGGRDRDDRPQMYKATCADCGDACEVPFRPSGDRPVLCKDCFRGNDDRPRREERSFGKDRDRGGREDGGGEMFRAVCSDCGDKCEVPFRPSADKPVFCSECFGRNKSAGKNSEKASEQLEMINAKLDKILKLITPVIEVSKDMQQEQAAKAAFPENIETEAKPKKKKASKKEANVEVVETLDEAA